MHRILITGSNGLLGQKICKILSSETEFSLLLTSIEKNNYQKEINSDYIQLDITNKSEVKNIVHSYRPTAIINTAANTIVDECETDKEAAWRINVDAVKNLIIASRSCNARIIHFSSDYIFDGKNGPYDESEQPNPINYYGKSKLASENALVSSGIEYTIIRTNILYGLGNSVKINFPLWLVSQLQSNQMIQIAEDQFGNPTIVDDLAFAVMKIIENNRKGIYHCAGSEYISRYKFALAIAKVFMLNNILIRPVKTNELNQMALRPLKSGLTCFKANSELGIKFLNVEEGLSLFKRQIELEGLSYIKNNK